MSSLETLKGRGIYQDLLNELIFHNKYIYVVSPCERRKGKPTHMIKGENWEILKVKTLNLQKTNIIEKGIGQLLMENQFNNAINKYWKDIKFDLVLYSTPPITFNKVIQKIKNRDKAKSYLLLKDIFPQNAVDLKMMKGGSFIHKIFRKKEKELYALSDRIGCMSPANMKYLIDHNPEINPTKVELSPNSIKVLDFHPISSKERESVLSKYEIPTDKTIFIYGGNLGKPQGIDFLIEVIAENEINKDSFILVIGSGTEYHKIKQWFETHHPANSMLHASLPKADYDKLLSCADVGLIFLDHRFTIPNYPSRLLGYMENAQPVLCATDPNTDIGKIAEENGYGLWCESNDINAFMSKLKTLSQDEQLRENMGKKGREFLEKNYTTKQSAISILNFIKN